LACDTAAELKLIVCACNWLVKANIINTKTAIVLKNVVKIFINNPVEFD
jgi:hypothetical protein